MLPGYSKKIAESMEKIANSFDRLVGVLDRLVDGLAKPQFQRYVANPPFDDPFTKEHPKVKFVDKQTDDSPKENME